MLGMFVRERENGGEDGIIILIIIIIFLPR